MKKNETPTGTIDEIRSKLLEKHAGNMYELISDGETIFISNPINNLTKMKAIIHARRKSVGHMVDSIINNCWLGGNEELKKDEAFKQGLEKQLDKLIDIPEPEVKELKNGNYLLTIDNFSIELRPVERTDIRYAEDYDHDDKPFQQPILILDRVAVDKEQLEELKASTPLYIAVLSEVRKLKKEKEVEIKKL